jgi:hypothetical protein
LEPAAFAALVPNSAEKVLGEVIEEIMGDHEMLVGSYLHYISVILLFFLFLGYQVKVLPYACRQERTQNEENVK